MSRYYYYHGVALDNLEDYQGACSDWKKETGLSNKEATALIKKYCTNI